MMQQTFLLTGSPHRTPHWNGCGASAAFTGTAEHAGRYSPAELRRALPAATHCTNTMIPSLHISSALLLASSEELAAVDRRMLRAIGVRHLKMLTSGTQAARLLCGEENTPPPALPDAVFCADALTDMSGVELLELLRLHPRTLSLPVLLLTGSNAPELVRRSAAAGRAAVLGRPYSAASLRTVLFALLNAPLATPLPTARKLLASGAFDAALESYEQAAAGSTAAPEEHFAQGLACLQQREWDNALRAFQQAMQAISLRGDAQLGMAAAWKGKGDERKYREYMARAAETFALAEKWNRARTTYERLLRDDPTARNPFLRAVERLVRDQRFDAAAVALAAGHDLTSADALHAMLAKTFLASDAPERQVATLQRALKRTALAAMSAGLGASVRQTMHLQTRLMRERRAARAQERQNAAAQINANQQTAADPLALHMPDANERARQNARPAGRGKIGIELRDLPDMPETIEETRNTRREVNTAKTAADGQRNARTGNTGSLPPDDRTNRDSARGGTREAHNADRTDILEPLTENQLRSTLFTSLPLLNEVLSVIKTTWQLSRRR